MSFPSLGQESEGCSSPALSRSTASDARGQGLSLDSLMAREDRSHEIQGET